MFYTSSMCVLSIISLNHCLLLPGPCPEMPPSNLSLSHHTTGVIHVHIPFETKSSESRTFSPIRIQNLNCLIAGLVSENGILSSVHIKYNTFKSTPDLKTVVNGTENGSIFVLEEVGHIETGRWRRSVCQREAKETLRFWMEEEFKVLWSCREDREKDRHDEALIVALPKDESRLILNVKFIQLVKRYFGEDLRRAPRFPPKQSPSLVCRRIFIPVQFQLPSAWGSS